MQITYICGYIAGIEALLTIPSLYLILCLFVHTANQACGTEDTKHTYRHTHAHERHTQSFYGTLSGSTLVSRWQKKSSSGLYGARADNRSRHTDHPAGRHSIRISQRPTPTSTILRRMPLLRQPSQFILSWDRHKICWPAYPVVWLWIRNKPSTIFYRS